MAKATRTTPSHPGFVVLRRLADGRWELLGEVDRRPGLAARAARAQAIRDISAGHDPAGGDVYAAVLRSEWRIAQDW